MGRFRSDLPPFHVPIVTRVGEVPSKDAPVFRRAPAKHDCDRRLTRQDGEESAWRARGHSKVSQPVVRIPSQRSQIEKGPSRQWRPLLQWLVVRCGERTQRARRTRCSTRRRPLRPSRRCYRCAGGRGAGRGGGASCRRARGGSTTWTGGRRRGALLQSWRCAAS